MKTYSLSRQGISKIRRQFLLRMSIILGIICCVIVGINLWRAPDNGFIPSILSFIVCAGVFPFSLSFALKKNIEIWESILIEITDNYIGRSQVRIPQVRIYRQEITSIDEIGGGICIRTSDKLRTLSIPNILDSADYQEIKEKLSLWIDIQPNSQKTKTQNILLFSILIIGFAILFLSMSLWVVLITGIVVLGYFVYYYWSLRKSEGVDPLFLRNMLVTIIILVLISITKICYLSGGFDLWIRYVSNS